MNDYECYAIGIICASVCTSLSIEDATARLNADHPTGIASQWSLSEDKAFASGVPNGAVCENSPETHRHYLFNC